MAGIKEMLEQSDSDALEFLDEFKLNLFAKEIRVFTPKGHMKTLPKGATALDFAYDIHTEIGNTCIGAKVNHKLVPMSYVLQSGDQVEVLTSDRQKPQKEWLDFVVTAKAKSHIDAAFKKERKDQIRRGIIIFEGIVKELKLPSTSEPLKKILAQLKLKSKEDLYAEIARNVVTREQIVKELKKKAENRFMKYWKLQFLWSDRDSEDRKIKIIGRRKSVMKIPISSSPCCSPIPGDDVVGIV
ncbi:MAG: TGS domain-containing protein [Odoribacter splanchnicus]